MTTKNQITMRDRLHVASFLEANTVPDGPKCVKYANGIADDADAAKRLTDILGRPVTTANVVSTRRSLGLTLARARGTPEHMAKMRALAAGKSGRKPKNPPAIEGIVGAINDLRAEISDLRAALERSGDIPMVSRRLALAGE